MRKLIFQFNITMDGFVDHDAMIADDELHDVSSELLETADLVLFGRVMYELLVDFWPSAPADKTLPASMRNFGTLINRVPKIVYSKTLQDVQWNARIEREVDPVRVMEMKTQPGGNIGLAGGPTLARTFMKYGLIDEYRFLVHPIILGHGKRLTDNDRSRQDLKLVDTRILGSGVVELIYRKAGLEGKW